MSTLLGKLVADVSTAWCDVCKRRTAVLDIHDEPGTANSHGRSDVFQVTDLACGHQTSRTVPGVSDWVL